MVIIDQLRDFIADLDEKNFYRALIATIAVVVLIITGVLYFQQRKIATLKKRITTINRSRTTVQEILTKFEKVKQQKAEVAGVLEKDKSFKILGEFDKILQTVGLSAQKASHTILTESLESLPEYNEVRLVVSLTDLNMRQLTELLQEIEKNERIHIKDLEITRNSKPSIDVTLTVATLLSKTQATEVES